MTRAPQRIFDDAFKLAALARLAAGERAAAVAADLQVLRKDLYAWRAQVRTGGAAGLHRRSHPRPGEPPPGERAAGEQAACEALARALARVAELERKVGQQQIDLDFFRAALRHAKGPQRPTGGSGATPSTTRSGS